MQISPSEKTEAAARPREKGQKTHFEDDKFALITVAKHEPFLRFLAGKKEMLVGFLEPMNMSLMSELIVI